MMATPPPSFQPNRGSWWRQWLGKASAQPSELLAQLMIVAENTTYQFVFFDRSGAIEWVNPAFEKLTGYSLEQIKGKHPQDVLHGSQTSAKAHSDIAEAMLLGRAVHTEICYRTRDAQDFWLELDIQPVKDANGTVSGFVSVQRDISTEVAQRERLRATFNTQACGLILFDAQGLVQEANAHALQMLELGKADLIGSALNQHSWHKEDGSRYLPEELPVATTLAKGQNQHNMIVGFKLGPTRTVWLKVSTELVNAALGSAGGALATLVDITALREHDHALQLANSQAQLALSELIAYRTALDMHSIVSVTDPKGNITFVNPRFSEISGYAESELLGQNHRLLKSPGNPVGYFEDLWRTVQSGHTWHGDICNRAKDGSLFWVDSTITPVLDNRGQIAQYVAIYYDITLRRQGERHLRESRERFRSLLAMSSDWYWECNQDFQFSLVSEGIDRTGINRLGMMGKRLWELEVDAADPVWKRHQTDLKANKAFSDFEFRLRKPDAPTEWVWLSLSGQPMLDISGRFIGYRGVGRDVTAHRAAQDQMWELANLDALTGLPNRMRFNAALEHAIAEALLTKQPFALAIIDLDNFKEVNDLLGHDVGDELLASVAKRLRQSLRSNDLIARLGGDEFGMLIHDIGAGPTLARPLEAMMNAMTAPMDLAGQLRRVSLSMGVTLFPDDAFDSASLIKNADIALYRAKAAGRGQYVLFRQELRLALERQAQLLAEVEDAIRLGTLTLQYQPVVDIDTHSVVSFEALLRWQHPTHGLVSVGLYPQVFENQGLSARIGRLVAEFALSQAAQWLHDDVPFARVAINVTAADFVLNAFPENLAERMAHHGLLPQHVGVEVTEGMFLGRTAVSVLSGLHDIHKMGCEISFDDFGTGYASLMHLKLPIDRLKIDRSFVTGIENDPTNAAIVRAIADLSKALGKKVTVEGVETQAQVELLKSMGCRFFQGNYFSKPLYAFEVPEFIADFNRGGPGPWVPPKLA